MPARSIVIATGARAGRSVLRGGGGRGVRVSGDLSVTAALSIELGVLGNRDKALATGTLAATARVLARKLDDPGTSATAAASNAKELREHLAVLRELSPVEVAATIVDELRERAGLKLAARK